MLNVSGAPCASFGRSWVTILGLILVGLQACGDPLVNVDFESFENREEIAHPQDFMHIDPKSIIPQLALRRALAFLEANQAKIPNKNYLTIIDYTQHSGKRRFFVLDLRTGAVEALHTAHGKGSDRDADGVAEQFSNVAASKMSSLGFYLSGSTYNGSNGLSLTLNGLSATNSKARERMIVIHGANYVNPNRPKMGRSFGCPALSMDVSKRVIRQLMGGSLIYAWHASKL